MNETIKDLNNKNLTNKELLQKLAERIKNNEIEIILYDEETGASEQKIRFLVEKENRNSIDLWHLFDKVKETKEDYMMFDEVKLAISGIHMFLNKYKAPNYHNWGLPQKIEWLKEQSEDEKILKEDREQMKDILGNLDKILTYKSCEKQIDWDNNEGKYSLQPKTEAVCKDCHKLS